MALSDVVNNWFATNPNATPQQVASAVQSIGGLGANPGLADIIGQHYGVSGADVGTAYNQLTAPLSTTTTPASVTPPPPLAPSYQNLLTQQTDPMKTGISNVLTDKSISLDEANQIQAFQNQYNFKPEDIARVTGYTLPQINQLLGAKNEITNKNIAGTINQNLNNPLGLADFAVQSGYTAKQMADASGGKFTEAQAQDLINKSQNIQTRLQLTNPDAYNRIKNLSQATANENWGGVVQPYQYQIFMPLDTSKVGAPTQLEKDPGVYRTIMTEDGPAQALVSGGGFKGVMSLGPDPQTGDPLGYVSTTPTYINQIPVVATYDQDGKLTGYQQFKGIGGELLVTGTGGKGYVSGKWDASGNPNPARGAWGSGGGFLGDLGPMVIGGALNLAFPGAGAAVGGALGITNTALASMVGNALINASITAASGGSPLNSLTSSGIGALTGYATSQVPGIEALNPLEKKFVDSAVKSALTNGDITQGIVNTAMSQVSGAITGSIRNALPTDIKAEETTAPSGLQYAGLNNGVISDAGGSDRVAISGTPKYQESLDANNTYKDESGRRIEIVPPPGYAIMSKNDPSYSLKNIYPDENDPSQVVKADGSYYDVTQNAWFKPSGEDPLAQAKEINTQLQNLSLPSGYGTNVTGSDKTAGDSTGALGTLPSSTDRSLTTAPTNVSTSTTQPSATSSSSALPSTDVGTIEVVEKRPDYSSLDTELLPSTPDYSSVTDTVMLPDTKAPVVATPTKTTTPTVSVAASPLSSVTPTTKTPTSVLSNVQTEAQKLDSSPQSLSSYVTKQRKILQDLHQLFGTITPELASVLAERGVVSPKIAQELVQAEQPKEEAPTTTPEENPLAALQTKFVASGGSIDKIDPTIQSINPRLLPAAQVIDMPSRLGALRHIYGGLTTRQPHLRSGGLPHKYAQAAPDGHHPEFITGLTGYYAGGRGTGQSDDIPAMLHDGDYVMDAEAVSALGDGSSKAGNEALMKFMHQIPHQDHKEGKPVPAKIADGEVVLPESFVTALGQGDNKRGANMLDEMRERLRQHKRSAPLTKIPPKAKTPLEYLEGVKG